jgi:kinesin family protein 13
MVRVRPFNSREMGISQAQGDRMPDCVVRMRGNTCVVLEHYKDDKGFRQEREREAFQFDECFWSLPAGQAETSMPFADQQYVYMRSGFIAMNSAFDGFNVCIFAYGQTGSGKTHSMLGTDTDPGVSPRLVDDLFKRITSEQQLTPTTKCTVECMFFEIYNEKVRDLFNKKAKMGEYDNPKIRQHPTKGIFVEGLIRKECATALETKDLLQKGSSERAMSETKMNKTSSRSHAVFQVQLTQMDAARGVQRVATINLVDLAGSEKVRDSGVTGDAFTEAKNINLSLSTLRKVIDVLIENSTSKRKKVPPFRESILTYVLSDSLGGNSKTQMMTAVSPHQVNLEDTLNTLRYALRAKAIVNNAHVNEEKSAKMMDAMRDELLKLREQLATGGPAASPGGGEGRLMMPDEIKHEIELRETEMRKLEDEQRQMQELIEANKAKEEEMNAKLEEAREEQAALAVAVSNQKKERFAAAFRNAFLMSGDKKKIAASTKEAEQAQEKVTALEARLHEALDELSQTQMELRELKGTHARSVEEMEGALVEQRTKVADLTHRHQEATLDRTTLQGELDDLQKQHARVIFERDETRARLERICADAGASSRRVEIAEAERSRLKTDLTQLVFEQKAEATKSHERKEKYKTLLGEERARSEVVEKEVANYLREREMLSETIRALQALVRDRDSLVAHLQRLLDDTSEAAAVAKSSAGTRAREVAAQREAIQEYETASLQWMREKSALERELLQLRLQVSTSAAAASVRHSRNAAIDTSVVGSPDRLGAPFSPQALAAPAPSPLTIQRVVAATAPSVPSPAALSATARSLYPQHGAAGLHGASRGGTPSRAYSRASSIGRLAGSASPAALAAGSTATVLFRSGTAASARSPARAASSLAGPLYSTDAPLTVANSTSVEFDPAIAATTVALSGSKAHVASAASRYRNPSAASW